MSESDEIFKAKLNSETAKITWSELQRYFARGVLIVVANNTDLIDTAARFSMDDKAAVSAWLEQGKVSRPTDEDAQRWFEQETEFWAVVVAPWVLIQEISG